MQNFPTRQWEYKTIGKLIKELLIMCQEQASRDIIWIEW